MDKYGNELAGSRKQGNPNCGRATLRTNTCTHLCLPSVFLMWCRDCSPKHNVALKHGQQLCSCSFSLLVTVYPQYLCSSFRKRITLGMPLQPVQLVHYQPWMYSAHAPLIKHQCLASQVGNPSPLSAESGVKRFAANLNLSRRCMFWTRINTRTSA